MYFELLIAFSLCGDRVLGIPELLAHSDAIAQCVVVEIQGESATAWVSDGLSGVASGEVLESVPLAALWQSPTDEVRWSSPCFQVGDELLVFLKKGSDRWRWTDVRRGALPVSDEYTDGLSDISRQLAGSLRYSLVQESGPEQYRMACSAIAECGVTLAELLGFTDELVSVFLASTSDPPNTASSFLDARVVVDDVLAQRLSRGIRASDLSSAWSCSRVGLVASEVYEVMRGAEESANEYVGWLCDLASYAVDKEDLNRNRWYDMCELLYVLAGDDATRDLVTEGIVLLNRERGYALPQDSQVPEILESILERVCSRF